MTTQNTPFLRQQRSFPNDSIQALCVELDKSYVDTALRVNDRIVGIYPVSYYAATGESWFFSGSAQVQRSLRRVFSFGALMVGANTIAHGINAESLSSISPRSYGTYTDGTNWYGAIYASNTGSVGQVTFFITPTNIQIDVDATAPVPTSGYIVLEYVSIF